MRMFPKCTRCNGTGWIEGRTRKCPECKGTGDRIAKIRCPRCKGYGSTVINGIGNTRTERCWRCHGEGTIFESE